MTAPIKAPQGVNPAAGRAAADPAGVNAGNRCIAAWQEHGAGPKVMMPPPNDHDADDIAGWAGVVDGVRGTGPLGRGSGMAAGPSEHW